MGLTLPHTYPLPRTALHCMCMCMQCTVLHCTTLHYTALHYTALHCTTLLCTTLHYTVLYCTALLYFSALQCTDLRCICSKIWLHWPFDFTALLSTGQLFGLTVHSTALHLPSLIQPNNSVLHISAPALLQIPALHFLTLQIKSFRI